MTEPADVVFSCRQTKLLKEFVWLLRGNFFKKSCKFFKSSFNLIFEPCQLNKVTQDLICICKQKTFSPASSINSSQPDKALPVKTSKPSFITLFVYFGNSLFDFCVKFLWYGMAENRGKPFCS